jgi:hypothetical protein
VGCAHRDRYIKFNSQFRLVRIRGGVSHEH